MIKLFLICSTVLLVANLATAASAEKFESCVFEFADDGTDLEFSSKLFNIARKGAREPKKFVYETICDRNPKNTFQISGVTRDANGMFQTRSYKGLSEFDVRVKGCDFMLRFGIEGNQFVVDTTKLQCPKKNSAGVRSIEKQVNDGVFSVVCNDGSYGTASVEDNVYCGVSSKAGRSCKSGWSIKSAAEFICK